jgi:hypothetical protein
METLQYQTEVNNYIDNLVIKLQKDCPDKDVSRNAFKNTVLTYTSEKELNDYLVFSTTQAVSIKDAFICADAFFALRWPTLINLIDNL